jgi:hypothetical protein
MTLLCKNKKKSISSLSDLDPYQFEILTIMKDEALCAKVSLKAKQ